MYAEILNKISSDIFSNEFVESGFDFRLHQKECIGLKFSAMAFVGFV